MWHREEKWSQGIEISYRGYVIPNLSRDLHFHFPRVNTRRQMPAQNQQNCRTPIYGVCHYIIAYEWIRYTCPCISNTHAGIHRFCTEGCDSDTVRGSASVSINPVRATEARWPVAYVGVSQGECVTLPLPECQSKVTPFRPARSDWSASATSADETAVPPYLTSSSAGLTVSGQHLCFPSAEVTGLMRGGQPGLRLTRMSRS